MSEEEQQRRVHDPDISHSEIVEQLSVNIDKLAGSVDHLAVAQENLAVSQLTLQERFAGYEERWDPMLEVWDNVGKVAQVGKWAGSWFGKIILGLGALSFALSGMLVLYGQLQ